MAERAGAVVLGPGLGRTEGAEAFARAAAPAIATPLVIDADGLNAHAGALDALSARTGPTVLTPHEGELGRLLEREPDAIAADRLAAAREAAERSGAVVLLKGDDTIVARPAARRRSAAAARRRWPRRARATSSPASSARCWPRASSRSPPRRSAPWRTPGRVAAADHAAAPTTWSRVT